jgi:hypothetical protein
MGWDDRRLMDSESGGLMGGRWGDWTAVFTWGAHALWVCMCCCLVPLRWAALARTAVESVSLVCLVLFLLPPPLSSSRAASRVLTHPPAAQCDRHPLDDFGLPLGWPPPFTFCPHGWSFWTTILYDTGTTSLSSLLHLVCGVLFSFFSFLPRSWRTSGMPHGALGICHQASGLGGTFGISL